MSKLRRALTITLPWAAAWAAPAVFAGVLYSLGDVDLFEIAVGCTFLGVFGMMGAIAAELVRAALTRWHEEEQLEQVEALLRESEPHKPPEQG